MRWRKLNRVLHRDLGYFFAGTTLIYAISGLAINHQGDWNPNFIIRHQTIKVKTVASPSLVTREWVLEMLAPLGEKDHYRSHDFPTSKKVKIYLDEGSIMLHLATGQGEYETVRRRPFFYSINALHLSPRNVWLVFSDSFCIALLIICISGLLILRGKHGITRRGAVLVSAGLVVPLFCLLTL